MKMVDVKSVTQAVLNQLIGAKYFPVTEGDEPAAVENVDAVDSTLLVDMGEVAKSMEVAADLAYKTMIDQLGKMVIESRSYVASLPSLFVDPIEWGGFVEHVQVGLSDVYDDEMWNPDGFINYTDTGGQAYAQKMAEQEHAFYRPRVHAKVFKEAKAISVRLSTLRDQMFTAFKSLDEMNKFLSALYTSVDNTLQLKAQVYALATVATGIGRAMALGHGYDLRTIYNDETGSNIANSTDFRKNDAAMRWALGFMANTKDNFSQFSTAFNNGVEPVFTPADDVRTILLAKFANDAKFGVRANTFHEELIGIGDYERTTAWQGIQTAGDNAFNFGAVSKVMFTADSAEKVGITVEEGETGYTIPNVVGVMYDKYALGITLDKKKTTASYTAGNDSWNTFYHTLINYICNDNYNMVFFYISDGE